MGEDKSFEIWFTTMSIIENNEGFEDKIKEIVKLDFAVKLVTLLKENPMFPNTVASYDLFNNRFGNHFGFYGQKEDFVDGPQIEVDECVESVLTVLNNKEVDASVIRHLFGKGEFPFINIKYKVEDNVVFYGYYITR